MRFAATLLLATALTAPSVALASADQLANDLSAMGIEIFADDASHEGSRVLLEAPVLTGERIEIRAERLVYDPRDDTVTLQNARFTELHNRSAAPGTATEMVVQGLDALRMVNELDVCDPRAVSDYQETRVELHGLTVVPDDVTARQMGAERFSGDRVTLKARFAADGSCMTFDELGMQGVTTLSAERDMATMEAITLRAAYDGERTAALDFEMRQLSAFTAAGDRVASVGRAALTFSAEGPLPQSMPLDLNAAFDILIQNQASFSFDMREIFLDASEEFGGQPMNGHAAIHLRHADGQIDADIDADIRGLARLRLDLGLQVLPESAAVGLSTMVGPVPGLAAAERLAITRLRFAAADQGFADIAEGATGVSREQTLAQLRQQLNAAPQPLIEPVMGFATGVLNGGAGFRADPAQPVALTQLVMTGMLQPGLLGSILAISAE